MTRIERDASLHPSTVTAYSQSPRQVRRRVSSARRAPTKMIETTVHPLVWQTALDAAGGDARRLEVLSETDVRVHNDPSWRDR